MSLMATRIRLIREAQRLYTDHRDSLYVYAITTGADVDLDSVQECKDRAVAEIIEATTLDNTV